MGRAALNALVPNPFYGVITDPQATALNGRTVQQHRLLRPMPHFAGANVASSEPPIGNSSYHALQTKWDKRFSHGFSMLAHYTWSKMIDDSSHGSGNISWLGGSTSIQNIWDLDSERSLSAHDVTHRVVLAGVYQLPFGRDRKWASDVNRVADLGRRRMERQRRVLPAERPAPRRHPERRPDLGRHSTPRPRWRPQHLRSHHGPAQQLLQCRRLLAAVVGCPGTTPRTLSYRRPAIRIFDAVLIKEIATRDGERLEIRVEAPNVLNHPVFGDPNTSFGSTAFGQITGTKVGPRQMMIGLKYVF